MAKISETPELPDPTGFERVVVLSANKTWRVRLDRLIAPVIAAAEAALNVLVARAEAASTRISAISPRSGWIAVFTDSASNILGGWKTDATLWTATSGSIDGAIQALRSAVVPLAVTAPAQISDRAGWLHVFTDSQGGILGGFRSTGEFVAAAGIVGAAAADTVSSDIAVFGDSESENSLGWPELAAAFAAIGERRDIFVSGYGGQGARSILARQGGAPALITLPTPSGGRFPMLPAAVQAVPVTVTGSPLSYADPAQPKSMAGTLQIGASGIFGTLARVAGTSNYTFTRAVAGSADLAVDKAVAFVPDTAALLRRVQICWIGTNDLIPAATPAATIMEWIDAYVAAQPATSRRTVILMPVWDMDGGTSPQSKAIYAELLGLVRAKYPANSIDTLAVLQRAGNGSPEDNADIDAGLIPRSVSASDRLHFPAGGTAYQALATEIVDVIKRNRW